MLILGDSWTAGFEVPEDATYSSMLQAELRERLGIPVQVINGGVRGYGTDQALRLLQETYSVCMLRMSVASLK